jgi:hypothetical protein
MSLLKTIETGIKVPALKLNISGTDGIGVRQPLVHKHPSQSLLRLRTEQTLLMCRPFHCVKATMISLSSCKH